MSVYQVSRMRVSPGRLEDFMSFLDGIKEINKRYGMKSRKVLRTTIGGESAGEVLIVSEFENYSAWARWSEERTKDPDFAAWRETTPAIDPNAPAQILSMVLMTDITR